MSWIPCSRAEGPGPQIRQDAPKGFVVLAQVQFLPKLGLARVPKNQSCRRRRPMNAAFGQKHLLLGLKKAEFEPAGTAIAYEDLRAGL